MKKIIITLVNWFLAPRKREAHYKAIREWEEIEGIKPRRVKYDWKA